MKTTIKTLIGSILLMLCSCNTASKKDPTDAKDNLNKANGNLRQAARDSKEAAKEKTIIEWKTFNEKSEDAVAALDQEIKQFQKKKHR